MGSINSTNNESIIDISDFHKFEKINFGKISNINFDISRNIIICVPDMFLSLNKKFHSLKSIFSDTSDDISFNELSIDSKIFITATDKSQIMFESKSNNDSIYSHLISFMDSKKLFNPFDPNSFESCKKLNEILYFLTKMIIYCSLKDPSVASYKIIYYSIKQNRKQGIEIKYIGDKLKFQIEHYGFYLEK